ncbi:MAG: cytochrome c [Pseudomonadota bacterium]
MKKRFLIMLSVPIAIVGLVGCENPSDTGTTNVGKSDKKFSALPQRPLPLRRWYSETQVARGDNLFQVNCSECHKPDASGTPNWKERDADGKLPPPPLNGTAHAWHHPLSVLRRTVRLGGVPLGGSMPGFADKLNSEEIDAILAWVQSHWSDEIYRVWHERNTQASRPIQPISRD